MKEYHKWLTTLLLAVFRLVSSAAVDTALFGIGAIIVLCYRRTDRTGFTITVIAYLLLMQ
jgi:hypothetical protein